MRFQWLAFASIAKTSDAMVGHKASRSKGARSLAKAFYSGLLTFPRAAPSRAIGRTFTARQDARPARATGNVRLIDRKTASRPALPANRRRGEAQGA